ncbi:CRISPR-associated protein Cas4 [Methanobacterium paludis]|uniref:CRISPR-associated exonuclease Cas4 n=2 Tax=Methanobacterium paludis (strain DSM 25820 / JCM 18151 / SWAN1) TaxID=868131 RepID=F6D3H9_METPW|nr:CRISPR-associated protein Cas4 [Methanobacterium paludis]
MNGVNMMINVSSISEYIYCPVKSYIKHTERLDIQTTPMITGKLVHEVRRGFEELIKRNMWSVNEKMEIRDIFESLFEDVPEFVENKIQRYHDARLIDLETKKKICRDLKGDVELDSWTVAIKTQKIIRKTRKTGADIVDLLFPPLLLEFSIEDSELNLRGQLDRIEIVDGVYYPVELKTGVPPVKGVWKSDAIQIAAYAILMEQEFNKEVPVGFVDYMGAGQRMPVLVNTSLRNDLVNVLEDMKSMFKNGEIPELMQNPKKCVKCDYADFCEYRA